MAGDRGWGQIAHLDACPRSCNSQPRRVQDCAGSLMEEVAKADSVSARRGAWAALESGYVPTGIPQVHGVPLSHEDQLPTGLQLPGDWSLRLPPLLERQHPAPSAELDAAPLLQEKRLFRGAGAAGLR